MSDIQEARRSREIQEVHAGDNKGRDEGPELVPYHTPDADLESGDAREKKTGSPQLESYNDGDSQSRVGSVRGDDHAKWEWNISYIYRRFKPLFHLSFWLVWTA
jgi:CNT family concentrative nucleoside transporter